MLEPFLNSLLIAGTATVLASVLALVASALLFRSNFWGKSLAESVLLLPLVMPPTVLGYWLLTAFGRSSSFGLFFESTFGFPIVFTRVGAVLAATITAFPLVFQSALAALESVKGTLLEVAESLGAGKFKILRRVAIPLAFPGILSGAVLAFARALGEFGATLMVAGNLPGRTQTASLALFDAMQSGESVRASALAMGLSALALGCLSLGHWLKRKGLNRVAS
jgi:molybdate transport system permease protein